METVKQPSRLPTNKVAAFTAGSVIAVWIKHLAIALWPDLAIPELWEGLPTVCGFVLAYFVWENR